MSKADSTGPRPAAFLDRDGTMIVEHGFLGDPSGVEILPGVIEAIRMLNHWGYRVIGVSNQSGVARGYFGTAEVDAVNRRVIEALAQAGAVVDRIYYCPHQPDIARQRNEAPCVCRKPAPGMIHRALTENPIDLAGSFVAGDQAVDIGLAHAVGIPGILLLTGFGAEQGTRFENGPSPDYVADNLLEAVRWIGQHHGRVVPAKKRHDIDTDD